MSPKVVGTRRKAFASVILVLALAMAEQADDGVSPVELVDVGVEGPAMPLEVVNAMATKMQAENARLRAENAALRTSAAVNTAKQKILIAGGLVKRKKQTKKQKKAEKTAVKKGVPAIPPKPQLAPVISKGLAVMNKVTDENKKLEARLQKATIKIDAMKARKMQKKIEKTKKNVKKKMVKKQRAEPSQYKKIPFFEFTAASKQAKGVKNRRQCQDICDRQIRCKSFSWSKYKRHCVWSVDAVHYDPHYRFGVKAQVATEGEPLARWRSFPGIKFLTASSKKKENVSMADCQNICAKDAACKSYSYKTTSKFCTWSSNGVSYSEHFDYFEKMLMGEAKLRAKTAAATAKLKASMFAMEVSQKKKEAGARAKLASENKAKQRVKEVWVKNLPTATQEKKMKMKVQKQVAAMNVQLAAKKAAAMGVKEKKAESTMDKDRLAAYAAVTKMENALRQVKAREAASRKALAPLQMKVSSTKASIEKLNMKSKLNDVDFTTKQAALKDAMAALSQAEKKKDASVTMAAKATVETSRKTVKATVQLRDSLKEQIQKFKEQLEGQVTKLNSGKAKQATAKAAVKTKEIAMKGALKKLKTTLKKANLKLLNDKERAYAARLLTAKTKEKLAKVVRAKMVVAHWESTEELKHVATDAEREKAQQKYAETKGALFVANKRNKDQIDIMTRTAHNLARYKEGLHKAQKKVKKVTKTVKKNDLARKMNELRQDTAASPTSTPPAKQKQ